MTEYQHWIFILVVASSYCLLLGGAIGFVLGKAFVKSIINDFLNHELPGAKTDG